MKKVLVCKESLPAETRVALIPDDIKKLTGMGFEFTVVSGAGLKSGFEDADYEQAGAKIVKKEKDGLKDAEIVVRILKPGSADGMNPDTVHISFLDPFNEKDLLNGFAKNNIQAVSLEMIPRTTLAQKMDVQSSQTSLAGYVAVLNAAARMPKILPMMVTPAGTINPARVFVIGVGVAGLQAIATAKRLGARVDAFDTRPVVEEQVKSLGANFVKIDLGEMGLQRRGAVGIQARRVHGHVVEVADFLGDAAFGIFLRSNLPDHGSQVHGVLFGDLVDGAPHGILHRLRVVVCPVAGRILREVIARTDGRVHVVIVDAGRLRRLLRAAGSNDKPRRGHNKDHLFHYA